MGTLFKTTDQLNAIIQFLKGLNDGTDDDGLQVLLGQLSVGASGAGFESVFGEGDSVPVSIGFHYDATNQTGDTITGATDITEAIASDSDSIVPMFASNAVEQVIMIGEDFPPVGVKSKWDSLGSLASEPSNIVGEYYNNLSTWASSTYMVTNADFPYTKYSNRLASTTNEQLRFGLSILNPNADFELKTLTINGVQYTKYWVRIRLTSTLTTMPELQQVKSHTNRTEINADGVVEFFGNARGITNIEVFEVANSASDPANQNITYFSGGLSGGTAKLFDNEFVDTAVDSRMYLLKIANEVDTSTPAVLSLPFYIDGNDGGNLDLYFEIQPITQDFIYNTAVNPDSTINILYPIAVNSEDERQVVRVEIPLDKIDPTVGGVIVTFSRDGNSASDTVSNHMIIAGSTADGRRWRL